MARPGPGGGGKKSGKKGGGKQRPKGRLTRRATNNVQLQDAGQVNLLQQQLQQAQQDYLRQTQAADSIWPGAQEGIRDLPRPQFGQIQNDFDTALGTVQDLFGGGEAAPYMAEGEGAAGMGLGNAYGEAGATMLANAAAREGMYRSSAAREANLSQRFAKDNLLQQMQDTLQGYNNQMSQVRADDPWQIAQETQTLWDRAQQQKALKSKLASDAAFSEWLQGRASDLAAGRPGRPGNNGPGVGPGGAGPGSGDPNSPGMGHPDVRDQDGSRADFTAQSGRPANWANWGQPRRQRWRQAQRPQQQPVRYPTMTPQREGGPYASGGYTPNPIYQQPPTYEDYDFGLGAY